MHLHELMGWPGPMTQRQYGTWQAWLEMQWNKPSRADHYTLKVASVMAGKKLEPIQFGYTKPPTKEEIAADAKARAIARSGGRVVIKTVTKEQLERGDLGS